jgi:hypothetical protein
MMICFSLWFTWTSTSRGKARKRQLGWTLEMGDELQHDGFILTEGAAGRPHPHRCDGKGASMGSSTGHDEKSTGGKGQERRHRVLAGA